MFYTRIFSILCLFFLSGCAYVTATPYDGEMPASGIPIPEQIPFLVVSGANTSIIYANNPNKGVALKFGSFLAKHKFEAEFSNGSLSKVSSDQDTSAVAVKLIELVQEAVKAGTSLGTAFSGKSGAAGGTETRFGVFAFRFDNDGNFIGLKPVVNPSGLINVPKRAGIIAAPSRKNPITIK